MFVLDCATPCQFLGNTGTRSQPIVVERPEKENTSVSNENTKADESKNDEVVFCTLCNVEMSKAKTRFRIDEWEEIPPKVATHNLGRLEEVLPVIVYMCPKCGKIEFRVDEKLNKD
jgi:rubrerythrin